MAVKLQQVTNLIDCLAPKYLAYDWDNVGLQIGDYNQEINKVLVSLDVNLEVIKEAIDEEVDLIIAHHPVIFKGVSNIRYNTYLGKLIQKAIKADIAIYVAHTNYDIAKGGLNDFLAEKLGLLDIDILQKTYNEELKKLVVFVPKDSLDQVQRAISQSGGACIGNYSDCFFLQQGIGTFKPLEGSNPFLGEEGEISRVEEYRLETIVSLKNINKIIKSMIKAHPYEEVAYDVYPIERDGEVFGLGRIGYLEEESCLSEIVELVKERLSLNSIRVVGSMDKRIKKVAVINGSGADFIKKAAFQGADLLITGDIKYHDGQLAQELGITLLDAGHYETEVIMKEAMQDYLSKKIKDNKFDVEIIRSQVNTNPFQRL